MWSVLYTIVCFVFLVYLFYTVISARRCTNEEVHSVEHFYFYCIIPCYNEEKVIFNTITSLLSVDSHLKVIAVDDDSTDSTLSEISNIHNSRLTILKRKLPNAHTGKGNVLNDALKKCCSDVEAQQLNKSNVIIGVVDADGKLSKNSILELKKEFSNKEVSAVQLRVKMFSKYSNMLHVAQDVEFFTMNNMLQLSRNRTNTVGLSGNGQFFRLKPVVDNIGKAPWGNSLLDDYELTLKFMLHSLKIRYISKAYVYQEPVLNIKKFIKQRSRWVQGNLDCLKYLRQIIFSREIIFLQKISVSFFLSQPFLNVLADISVFVLMFRWVTNVITTNSTLATFIAYLTLYFFVSTFIGFLFTVQYHQDLKKNSENTPDLVQYLLLPVINSFIYIVLFISIIIAFWRKITKKSSWIKTDRN